MKRALLSAAVAAASLAAAQPVLAQASDPYLGQLMLVGFTYCPDGWQEANGQLLAVSSNPALFSLYGVTYGGNGSTTFGLPDLRGRVPAHTGTGPGLSPVTQGQIMGADSTVLSIGQMPIHNHALFGSTGTSDTGSPSNALLPTFAGTNIYSAAGAANLTMKPSAIGLAGGNSPFDQHQPTLVLRWCVATSGIFPPRP